MRPTILLAVDSTQPAGPAVAMVSELAQATGDDVVVLHVHEVAVGRWGRARVDCPEDEGEHLVEQIVRQLSEAGVPARGDIREALYGHVVHEILAAADDADPRLVVVCSRGRGDLGSLALGSVAHRLVHLAHRPVLVVPQTVELEIPAQAGSRSAGA